MGGFCYTLSIMALDWAKKMRLMLIGGIALVAIVVIGATVFAFVYKVPSCTDKTQNQKESGVDCGGPCTYLCTAQVNAPNVLFARALELPGGRTDVVAYIQNPNKQAQTKGAPYTIELYAADATLVARVSGFVDLPAGTVTPIYIRAAAQGSNVARAFINFAPEKISWKSVTGERAVPRVTDSALTEGDSPRVSAKLANETYDPMYDIRSVAVVYDSEGTAIAASETLVPAIRAQSAVPITFTWNEPFQSVPARFEVTPVVPLI